MNPKYWLAFSSLAGVGATQLAGCSSDFSSCQDSRTCVETGGGGDVGNSDGGRAAAGKGNSGSDMDPGGAAGATEELAGDGGEAPAVACAKDAECNDHLACNGIESCEDGSCKAGTSPCANSDPEHCDALCTESSDTATCSVRGKDEDKDGHFSSACKANQGDDCDDNVASVYPGAPELCDGLDNDCDQKLDTSDGLALGGKTIAIGSAGTVRSLPTIAWAAHKSVYGIAYRDVTTSATSDLYLEEVNQAGVVTLPAKPFNDVASKTSPSRSLGLAWGGDTFGVAFATSDDLFMRMIGTDGVATNAITLPLPPFSFYSPAPRNPSLARNSNQDWTIVAPFQSSGADVPALMGFRALASGMTWAQGTLSSGAEVIQDGNLSSVTATDTQFVIGSAFTFLFDSAFVYSKQLTGIGSFPTVAASQKGILFAYRGDSGGPAQLQLLSSAGVSLCGPVPFADKAFAPASAIATSTGYLVVSSGPVRVQEVFQDCTMGAAFSVDEAPYTSDVHIAGGAAGYGVVWQDTTANVPKARFFGPRYCD